MNRKLLTLESIAMLFFLSIVRTVYSQNFTQMHNLTKSWRQIFFWYMFILYSYLCFAFLHHNYNSHFHLHALLWLLSITSFLKKYMRPNKETDRMSVAAGQMLKMDKSKSIDISRQTNLPCNSKRGFFCLQTTETLDWCPQSLWVQYSGSPPPQLLSHWFSP